MFMFYFFMQTLSIGTPLARAQSYVKIHKKLNGHYLNDVVKEKCVYYEPKSLLMVYYL